MSTGPLALDAVALCGACLALCALLAPAARRGIAGLHAGGARLAGRLAGRIGGPSVG